MAGSWIIISCGIETSGFAALWTKTRSGKRWTRNNIHSLMLCKLCTVEAKKETRSLSVYLSKTVNLTFPLRE
jgi:hypothetical protein